MCWPSNCCLSCFKAPVFSSAKTTAEDLPLLSQDTPIRKKAWGELRPQDSFQCTKEFLSEGTANGHSFVLLFEPTEMLEERLACILQPVEKEASYIEFGDPTLELITQEDSGNLSPRVFIHAGLTLSWKGKKLTATFFGNKQSTVHLKPSMVARSSTTGKVCVVFEKKMQGYKKCILGPVPNDTLSTLFSR